MTKHIMTMAALSAALLLGTAGVTATAIDVGVSVGSGTNAAASASDGDTGATVNIGSGAGPLATVDSTDDGSQTDATVNLGSLLAGIDLGGGTGPGGTDGTDGDAGAGGGGGGGFQAIVNSLSAGDRELLALRCRNVLIDPTIYKDDVVDFCRMIAKLNM